MMKEAMLYRKLGEKKVQCYLCPHNCTISEGKRGICGVRENKEGKLLTLVYRKAVSNSADPIEKKPLFHFLPGTRSYSIATMGCNMSCGFCQNWAISQPPRESSKIEGTDISPEEIVQDALENDCSSIAYTYTEPTIFFEYAYETAKQGHENGLANVFVTNGFISKEAIEKISPYLDAANVDLKGFSEDFYRKTCGARLQPVLDTIRELSRRCIWLEITTLIVPGHNDNEKMLTRIAEFIASVDKHIPWHISRFHPDYKMSDFQPTDTGILKKAVKIGKQKGLKYIYLGNVPGEDISTFCPRCGKNIIKREGFRVSEINITNNRKCSFCNEDIDVVIHL